MLNRKWWILAAALLIIPGLQLTAGGSKERIIKVGAPLPLTGPYASDGDQMRKAIELGIDELNKAGGLLGHQLTLITGDVAALEPEKIQAVGERLLSEQVNFLITGYDDGGTDVYVFGGKKVPYLHSNVNSLSTGPVATNPDFRNCFQYAANEVDYGIYSAEQLWSVSASTGWKAPNKKVATIKVDYSYNIVPANKFNELAKAKGYEIVVDELHQFGVVDWGPIISKIEATRPSFVTFWNSDPTDAARFMIQLRERFRNKPLNAIVFMQFTPAVPEFLDLAGEAADGLIWTCLLGLTKDVSEYEQRFKQLHKEPPRGLYGYLTYDAFQIWVQAVKKVGDPFKYDQICEAIRSSTYSGMGGIYKFNPSDQSALRGDDFLPAFWFQIQGGKNVVLLPEKHKDGQARLPSWIKP